MKQYVISLALLIAVLVAFPTSDANAQSQAEMNNQAAKDFEKTDAELNSTYAALMAKLPDAESKRKLKESQRAWIAFRDAEAAFAADQLRGGSAAPVLRWTSMTQTTQQRVKQLKANFPDDGDSSNKTLQPTSAAAGAVSETIPAADEEPEGELITGKEFPNGFGVVRSSLSPDKRYGVLAPADFDHYDETKHQNELVEVNTGRTLAVIDAETGKAEFMNGGGIQPPRWSADGSFLLWEVAGKWSPRALVLLKIEDGKVKWQRDLLKMVQKEILARTRKASPTKYAAIKKRNSELDQDTYPDGFTVNVQITGKEGAPLTFPLNVEASLESDPKAMESPPKNQLSSEMKAVLDSDGKLIVKSFRTE